ncbi:DUF412 family protein [Salmonella enterica subsp. enterica]|nr:DUF412 family protein [Salmonella enterica subsp. enterica]
MSTPDNRSVNFFSLFRRGQHYAKTWPMEKRLAPVEGKPDYQALADTLKRAFKQLDKTFLDDL